MNARLLVLLFTVQLAFGAVKDSIQGTRTAGTVYVYCSHDGVKDRNEFDYKWLTSKSGPYVKVDGEWNVVGTRPEGMQATFIIPKQIYQSLLEQCKEDGWDFVQPVKQLMFSNRWYVFEMKEDENSCGAGMFGNYPKLGSFKNTGSCDRPTKFWPIPYDYYYGQ